MTEFIGNNITKLRYKTDKDRPYFADKYEGKAPFLVLFKRLSLNFTKRVSLDVIIKEYRHKYGGTVEEAKSMFFAEKKNFSMGKLNKKIMLSLPDGWMQYNIIPYNMYHNYCKGTTKHGLRCGTSVWKKQEYCSQHREFIPNDVGDTQKKILAETNIEKLRSICMVVLETYPEQWAEIGRIVNKRKESKRIHYKINQLEKNLASIEKVIKKLKEELK